MSVFHNILFFANFSTTYCNEHVEMNTFLYSLACTWMMIIIESQFYIIDILSLDVSL